MEAAHLPGRENEMLEIYSTLQNALQVNQGCCLCKALLKIDISGVPGTGKTATVHHVISMLQSGAAKKEISEFQVVEINGLKITDPPRAYSVLWKGLSGVKLAPASALEQIEKHFKKNSSKCPTIVILDEVDLLMTKKQEILYNFFEWPQAPKSRLSVIAIANTMDLPERVFCNRVASRLGMIRLNFVPYNHMQLVEILKCRMQKDVIFTPDALEFCARKVSSVSGDARRALSIAQLAADMACSTRKRRASNTSITIAHVDSAIKQMFSTISIQALSSASLFQKLLLVALASTMRRSGISETRMIDIHAIFMQMCNTLSLELPCTDTISACLCSLEQTRCIILEKRMASLHSRIRLNVSDDDIKFAFKDDKIIKKYLNY